MQDSNDKKHTLKDIFVTGFLAMLPLVITVYLLKVIYGVIVNNLKPIFSRLALAYKIDVPDPLVGILTVAAFVLFIFFIGLFTRLYVGKMLLKLLDKTISGIPLANTIYTAIKQMVDSFGASTQNFSKVVLVSFFYEGIYCIGLVVKDSQREFVNAAGEECYNVFVPTAPNPTSGFITIIKKRCCIDLPISVEQAVKFVLSVGILNFSSPEEAVKQIEENAKE